MNKHYYIYLRAGISKAKPTGTKWIKIGGKLQQIDMYGGKVWGRNHQHKIYSLTVTGYSLVSTYHYKYGKPTGSSKKGHSKKSNKKKIHGKKTNKKKSHKKKSHKKKSHGKKGKSKKRHSKKSHTTTTYKKTVRGKTVTLKLTGWSGHSGSLKVVSVGPAGIWGVNKKHKIYKW